MATSKAKTVSEYLAELPPERRAALSKVRAVIKANLPKGYKEGMLFGMIGYFIPLEVCPDTYNGQPLTYAGLAAQKNHLSLYLMNVYGNPEVQTWFEREWKKTGKKLDMGKSCIRFKSFDDLPLDLIGKTISRTPMAKMIEAYRKAHRTP